MSSRFDPLDRVGIIGAPELGTFLVKRARRKLDLWVYDLSSVQNEEEPIWGISGSSLYLWTYAGGTSKWDSEAI